MSTYNQFIQSSMSIISVNQYDIYYESYGEESNPAILMIQGVGSSCRLWPTNLVHELADAGYRVIIFDNRDVGKSMLYQGKTPNVVWFLLRKQLGFSPKPPYSLKDLACDAVSLLNYLNIDTAHLVGFSMGGMIAQVIAIEHPELASSLTLIGTNSGNPKLPLPDKNISKQLLAKPQIQGTDHAFDYMSNVLQTLAGSQYLMSDTELTEVVNRLLAQGMTKDGLLRHILAVAAAESRVNALQKLSINTQIIHGTEDNLVKPQGAIELAEIIPNAKLEMIEGLGHTLPQILAPKFKQLILTRILH